MTQALTMAEQQVTPVASLSTATTPAAASKRRSPDAKSKSRAKISNPASIVMLTTGSGESIKNFVVHKDFACHYSPVLKAAFNSNFLEGQTQISHLEDAKDETVSLLVNWFYSQELSVDSLEKNEIVDGDHWKLIRLWVLADKLLIPRLQNVTIIKLTEMEKAFNKTPVGCLNYIYNNTAAGSPLRLLLLHQCACLMDPKSFLKAEAEFPKSMLIELAIFACGDHSALIKRSRIRNNLEQYKVPEDFEA
ncbi:hypothetical protein DL98DRAFT_605229 [Cadophora sp. DSE1049]|nr:hypothetical protein DL98DRAFT_605229 [Cadophora sp. DSE1049]